MEGYSKKMDSFVTQNCQCVMNGDRKYMWPPVVGMLTNLHKFFNIPDHVYKSVFTDWVSFYDVGVESVCDSTERILNKLH